MDSQFLDDLARRLAGAVPEGFETLRRDLEANFRAVLQAGLARLDLVTRTEFDVQRGVLERAREKIAALERKVRGLEGLEELKGQEGHTVGHTEGNKGG